MKIIEGLKSLKDLQRKLADLKSKVSEYCADRDCEQPTYPDQKIQISQWVQSYQDIVKESLRLRTAIQKTNLLTEVTITIGGKNVKKTIAEWIHRRKDLAALDEGIWRALSDKNLKLEQRAIDMPSFVVKRRLYYDPVERDKKIEEYRSEPHLIDSALEIINCITDLLEI